MANKINYPAPIPYPKYETLLIDMPEPNIMKVTLNRPNAYNALSHKLVDEMTDLCGKLKDDFYHVRVVLLYGGDDAKGFCAGLDVKEGLDDYEKTVPGFYAYQIKLGEMELKMTQTPQPWIAMIDNVSAGGGFSLAMASDAITRAAAPSLTPEALPAVTLRSGPLTPLSFDSCSAVVPGRGCSSTETISGSPFFCGIVTGTISSAKTPAAWAAAQRAWLRAANASWSARLTLYCSATLSAVSGMEWVPNFFFSCGLGKRQPIVVS